MSVALISFVPCSSVECVIHLNFFGLLWLSIINVILLPIILTKGCNSFRSVLFFAHSLKLNLWVVHFLLIWASHQKCLATSDVLICRVSCLPVNFWFFLDKLYNLLLQSTYSWRIKVTFISLTRSLVVFQGSSDG